MKRCWIIFVVVVLVWSVRGVCAGTLVMVDGKRVEGEVVLEAGGVRAGGKVVELGQVERATFFSRPMGRWGSMTDLGLMLERVGDAGGGAGTAGIDGGVVWMRSDARGGAMDFLKVRAVGKSLIAGKVAGFEGSAKGATAGVMMRENLDGSGAFVALMVGAEEKRAWLTWRLGEEVERKEVGAAGVFVRLRNEGEVVTAETSADGKAWVEAGRFSHGVKRGWEMGFAAASGGEGAAVVRIERAEILVRGHVAEYFKDVEMKELLFRRVEPIVVISATGPFNPVFEDFAAARWTSEVVAPATEEISITVHTYFQSRLYVDGALVYESPAREKAERKDNYPLRVKAGQRIGLRFEYIKGKGSAGLRFLWSSPTIGGRTFMTGEAIEWRAERDSGRVLQPTSPGVRLRTGTYFPSVVRSTDGKALVCGDGAGKEFEVSMKDVGRIVFRALGPGSEEMLGESKAGVLMAGGDRLEAAFRSMDGEKVQVSSVIFGLQNLKVGTEAAAIVVGPVKEAAGSFRVKRMDGSVLCGKVRMEKGEVVVEEGVLGEVRVGRGEVWEIERVR